MANNNDKPVFGHGAIGLSSGAMEEADKVVKELKGGDYSSLADIHAMSYEAKDYIASRAYGEENKGYFAVDNKRVKYQKDYDAVKDNQHELREVAKVLAEGEPTQVQVIQEYMNEQPTYMRAALGHEVMRQHQIMGTAPTHGDALSQMMGGKEAGDKTYEVQAQEMGRTGDIVGAEADHVMLQSKINAVTEGVRIQSDLTGDALMADLARQSEGKSKEERQAVFRIGLNYTEDNAENRIKKPGLDDAMGRTIDGNSIRAYEVTQEDRDKSSKFPKSQLRPEQTFGRENIASYFDFGDKALTKEQQSQLSDLGDAFGKKTLQNLVAQKTQYGTEGKYISRMDAMPSSGAVSATAKKMGFTDLESKLKPTKYKDVYDKELKKMVQSDQPFLAGTLKGFEYSDKKTRKHFADSYKKSLGDLQWEYGVGTKEVTDDSGITSLMRNSNPLPQPTGNEVPYNLVSELTQQLSESYTDMTGSVDSRTGEYEGSAYNQAQKAVLGHFGVTSTQDIDPQAIESMVADKGMDLSAHIIKGRDNKYKFSTINDGVNVSSGGSGSSGASSKASLTASHLTNAMHQAGGKERLKFSQWSGAVSKGTDKANAQAKVVAQERADKRAEKASAQSKDNELLAIQSANPHLSISTNEQGSDAWKQERLEVTTATQSKIARTGKSIYGDTDFDAFSDVLGEERSSNYFMDVGSYAEEFAQRNYEEMKGVSLQDRGMITNDNIGGLGISSDGFYMDDQGDLRLTEIKTNAFGSQHKSLAKHEDQARMQMYVTGAKSVDMVSNWNENVQSMNGQILRPEMNKQPVGWKSAITDTFMNDEAQRDWEEANAPYLKKFGEIKGKLAKQGTVTRSDIENSVAEMQQFRQNLEGEGAFNKEKEEADLKLRRSQSKSAFDEQAQNQADYDLVEEGIATRKRAEEAKAQGKFDAEIKADERNYKAKIKQAQDTNKAMTSEQDVIGKSAKDSASVFQEDVDNFNTVEDAINARKKKEEDREIEILKAKSKADEKIVGAKTKQAQDINKAMTSEQDVVGKSAKDSASAFEDVFKEEERVEKNSKTNARANAKDASKGISKEERKLNRAIEDAVESGDEDMAELLGAKKSKVQGSRKSKEEKEKKQDEYYEMMKQQIGEGKFAKALGTAIKSTPLGKTIAGAVGMGTAAYKGAKEANQYFGDLAELGISESSRTFETQTDLLEMAGAKDAKGTVRNLSAMQALWNADKPEMVEKFIGDSRNLIPHEMMTTANVGEIGEYLQGLVKDGKFTKQEVAGRLQGTGFEGLTSLLSISESALSDQRGTIDRAVKVGDLTSSRNLSNDVTTQVELITSSLGQTFAEMKDGIADILMSEVYVNKDLSIDFNNAEERSKRLGFINTKGDMNTIKQSEDVTNKASENILKASENMLEASEKKVDINVTSNNGSHATVRGEDSMLLNNNSSASKSTTSNWRGRD